MKVYLTILGFVLFFLGFLSLVLSLVGLKLTLLTVVDSRGAGFGFLIKLLLMFGGMILFYAARTMEIEVDESNA